MTAPTQHLWMPGETSLAWLQSIGVPPSGIKLTAGPRFQKFTVVYGQVVDVAGPAGPGIAPAESDGCHIGFDLRYRGPRYFDPDVAAAAKQSDAAIRRAFKAMPYTFQGLRLLRGDWMGSGPQRDTATVEPGTKDMWRCSYWLNIIEHL